MGKILDLIESTLDKGWVRAVLVLNFIFTIITWKLAGRIVWNALMASAAIQTLLQCSSNS